MATIHTFPDKDRTAHEPDQAQTVRVWDPFVRLFHWSLVAAVAAAGVTGFLLGPTWISLHVWAGTAMAALVVARIVWGFSGGTYARFSSFLTGPREAIGHLRGVLDGTEGRHLGHNSLGGLMIVALLIAALAIAATGAVALGGMLKFGPFASLASFASGITAREVHSFLAWALLALVGLHVAGAIYEGMRTRDNLVRAMVTGVKPSRKGDVASRARAARPLAAAVAGLVLLGGGAAGMTALAARPASGVPAAPLDATYAEECGDCHAPFHPSLLPAASWHALFANLGDHFGEDASLDPATTAALESWVAANAADVYDTLPANMLRRVNADNPYQITATRFWQRTHEDIPDAVFKSSAVGSKANCAACHGDAATGLFDPRRIAIPKEANG